MTLNEADLKYGVGVATLDSLILGEKRRQTLPYKS